MKKFILKLIIIMLSSSAEAAYNNQNLSEYDLDTGLYIRTVSSNGDTKSDFLSSSKSEYSPNVNLFVFNPKDNTYRHLLDKNYGEITNYIVESGFQKSDIQDDNKSAIIGTYVFLSGDNKVQNNTDIAKRAINQNIIIETYNSKNKNYTVWIANKLAGNASLLFSYDEPSQWHLDVKNQQIRLVTPGVESKQMRLKIKSYAW